MRAAILASVLVFTASAAVARPLAAMTPDEAWATHLALPSQDRMVADFARRDRADSALIGASDRTQPATAAGLSLGLVQAEAVDDPRPGRHRRVLQYRVDGVSVLGGSVGGSLGGGGAVFSLHWPSGQ